MTGEQILEFLNYAEGLKRELRHSWLSNDRQESVAEHTWRSALMAMLIAPELEQKVDLFKVLKMIIIHDINEAGVGDVPAFMKKQHDQQKIDEADNMNLLKEKYKSSLIDEIAALWQEYEDQETSEAKFVKALDKMEVRIQHNEAKINTWNDIEYPRSLFAADKYTQYDKFIKSFNDLLKAKSRNKIIEESSKNIEEVEKEAETLKVQDN